MVADNLKGNLNSAEQPSDRLKMLVKEQLITGNPGVALNLVKGHTWEIYKEEKHLDARIQDYLKNNGVLDTVNSYANLSDEKRIEKFLLTLGKSFEQELINQREKTGAGKENAKTVQKAEKLQKEGPADEGVIIR